MKLLLYISIFIIAGKSCNGQQPNSNDINKLLQGKWYSIQDSNSTIIFSKDTMREFYIGYSITIENGSYIEKYDPEVKEVKELGYSIFKVTSKITRETCTLDTVLSSPTGFYIESYDPEIKGAICYSIALINEKHLELVYLAGGRVLHFKRER